MKPDNAESHAPRSVSDPGSGQAEENESIADLCDHHDEKIHVAQSLFRSFGGTESFQGIITTLKVDKDFLLIKETLSGSGDGGILVIDGGGTMECALLGDRLATMAMTNAWAGIVINGCVRDSAELRKIGVGVKALNTCPRRPALAGGGDKNIAVSFAGVTFTPGDYLYADSDGIIVTALKLQSV